MKNEITLQTRREFLRTTVLGSALSWTVPTFLADTFAALQSQAADSATQIATGKDATILVVLQMAGGKRRPQRRDSLRERFLSQRAPQDWPDGGKGFEAERRHRFPQRDDRVQKTFTIPAISPSFRASAIRTRTAPISVPPKSGRPPVIRTRLRNTDG